MFTRLLEGKTNGTGDIHHGVCVVSWSFADDSNGNDLAGKGMGNIGEEVNQLCIRRRKCSCISNCPIKKSPGKPRFITSIFQALTEHFYSTYWLEYLIELSPFFFPSCMQCNRLKQELSLKEMREVDEGVLPSDTEMPAVLSSMPWADQEVTQLLHPTRHAGRAHLNMTFTTA